MTIGFDRKIRTRWLDLTARLAAEGLSPPGIRELLHEEMEGEVSGNGPRSARGKTKTVLLHIWVTVPDSAALLRDEALTIVARRRGSDLRALHWGMCLATYPFFRDTAAITGRLLALQETAALSTITRRMVERWGARSTVLRAAQRVVRSMVDWGVLAESGHRGVFRRGTSITVPADGSHAGWLIEAALVASGRPAMPLSTLVRHPMLFALRNFATTHYALSRTTLEVFREGSGEDMVGLKQQLAGSG